MEVKKHRSPALDVVRIFATFCVVAVHFFGNSDFYNRPISGKGMLVAVTLREFFMICIPLFLILSGYLLSRKTLTKNYFKRIFPILGTFILAEIACWIYRLVWQGEPFNINEILMTFLNFRAAPYGWYIEMYIGLFLLIPFLNILWHSLRNAQQKRLLLLILFVLSILPSVIGVYDFATAGWWAAPAIHEEKFWHIIPNWWETQQIAFIFYYFVGCYLKEFPLKLKKYKYILAICGLTIVGGLYNFWRSHHDTFTVGVWSEHISIFVAGVSVAVFSLLTELKYKRTKGAWLARLSSWCLGAYLVSWIFDMVFYEKVQQMEGAYAQRLVYMPIIVPLVFVCSVALSAGLSFLQKGVKHIISSDDLRRRAFYWLTVVWAGLMVVGLAIASVQSLTVS